MCFGEPVLPILRSKERRRAGIVEQDLIERVYNAFNPLEALAPDDPRYVDLRPGLFDGMVREIRRSRSPAVQLLAGYRGTGKTTELLRLCRRLAAGEAPHYFVSYC